MKSYYIYQHNDLWYLIEGGEVFTFTDFADVLGYLGGIQLNQ